MKYLVRFVIWSFYGLYKIFWYLIHHTVVSIWDFNFDSFKYDYILSGNFYCGKDNTCMSKTYSYWYYVTFLDALKDNKKRFKP